MSIFRNAGNNRKYTDWYELYKRRSDTKAYELSEIAPEATFRACDVVDYYEVEEQLNGVSMCIMCYLTIETPAQLVFNPGDELHSLKDDKKWIVRKATTKDDNKGKDKSMRPLKVSVIELAGTVDATG